ncbi:MAG: protein kinase [Kofleriaceae bacterium]|nr:protein kinase [Kofleriaceae bacterium]
MTYVCPTCRRSFEAPGPCPFDRTEVVDRDVADNPTMLDRKSTLPLTVTPPPAQPEPIRTRPTTSDSVVKVLSASESERDVLAMIGRSKNSSQYDALIGHTLDGRYYVDKKIGEGGMGVVFSARHAVIERPLAIKVLKRDVTRDPATIQRFVQEAKAASRIGHPNIIDVTDFGTTPDGMTYAVMELVIGNTLKATLRAAAPLPALRAIKIAAQIARALGAAHDKGIVHRDLKPENVFLIDREGRTDFVKIVDFGIAKVAPLEGHKDGPRLTRAGTVFGTPEYMAPEQAAGKSDTDHRVDIYALGVILYEMVTGKVPHRGDSTVRTLAMQMLDPVVPPSKVHPDASISPELEAVILKALAKKREDRYARMSDLLAELERVHAVIGQSITGSPIYALTPLPPGADQPRRPKTPTNRIKGEPEFASTTQRPTFDSVFEEPEPVVQRSRWPMVAIALLGVGAVAAAIVLFVTKSSSPEAPPRAPIVARTPPDAAPVVEPLADAAEEIAPPVDAAVVVVRPPVDAGVRVRPPERDAGAAGSAVPRYTPNGRGTIMVQVITKPERAQLFVGTTYRGDGGTTLEEPWGAKLDIRCHQKGYKDGTVQVTFDGNTEIALCVLTRIKICIDNVKNPFDDCELDPTKPSGPSGGPTPP